MTECYLVVLLITDEGQFFVGEAPQDCCLTISEIHIKAHTS